MLSAILFQIAFAQQQQQQQPSSESVSFSLQQIVHVGTNLKGFSAILPNYNWRTGNVTEVYVGSAYGKALYRYDLASGALSLLRAMPNGVASLAFSGFASNQLSLQPDNATELFVGSAFDGSVIALKLDQNGNPVVRSVTGVLPLDSVVRSLAFTRHNQQLHAATCNSTLASGELYQFENSHIRQQFNELGSGYGCLGQMQFGDDNVLYTVDEANRSVVAVYSGKSVFLASLPPDVIPVGLQFNSKWRAFVGANRVAANRREAEIYSFDVGSRTLTLVAAIGGAVLDTFAISFDDRLFVSDRAHAAIYEIDLADELSLIDESALLADAAQRDAARFRSRLLFGSAGLTAGGGVAAFSTPDGTEIALVADLFSIKSITARQFVDTWPLPALARSVAPLGVASVHVEPRRYASSTSSASLPRAVFGVQSTPGGAIELSPFAPLKGDLALMSSWSSFVQPFGVAHAADGSVLVADFGAGQIVQTDGFVAASDLDGPVGIALADANGKYVYVTEWLTGNLLSIDVDAHTRQVLLSGLDHPEGVAVNPLNGHVVVIESGGLGRLIDVNPSVPGAVTVLASHLPTEYVAGDTSPGVLQGVAFGDVVPSLGAGLPRTVALYVTAGDASVRRWTTSQVLTDPNAKPLGAGVVLHPTGGVVALNLWHVDMPAHIAVAAGTTVRFIARRLTPTVDAQYDASGVRWLTSNNIPGWVSQWIYPAIAHDVFQWQDILPPGPSHLDFTFNVIGTYTYQDAVQGAPGIITVYDPLYDEQNSGKFIADGTFAPTPAPTTAAPCRLATSVACPPGTSVDASRASAQGCLPDPIRCYPVGFSSFMPLYVPNSGPPTGWRAVNQQAVQGPAYATWASWRAWWQYLASTSGNPDVYWYSSQYLKQ